MYLDNDIFKCFAFYASLNLLKMMALALWTGKTKHATRSFPNKEDADRVGAVPGTNEDVERVLRAHRNDIENILPFVGLGIIYCLSGPGVAIAKWHFRIFTFGRFLHSVAYLNHHGPARGIGFMLGLIVCLSMGVQNAMYYFDFS